MRQEISGPHGRTETTMQTDCFHSVYLSVRDIVQSTVREPDLFTYRIAFTLLDETISPALPDHWQPLNWRFRDLVAQNSDIDLDTQIDQFLIDRRRLIVDYSKIHGLPPYEFGKLQIQIDEYFRNCCFAPRVILPGHIGTCMLSLSILELAAREVRINETITHLSTFLALCGLSQLGFCRLAEYDSAETGGAKSIWWRALWRSYCRYRNIEQFQSWINWGKERGLED